MTNAKTIRDALAERPFRPFSVRTVSGRDYRIPHPEHALVSPGGRNLIVTFDDDAVKVLDMLMIEGIDYPRDRNGTRGLTAAPREPTDTGNYRQHITFAGVLGVGYAWAAYALAGVHWLYGSVAALLATLSGLLPDLDSPSGVELKGFTGILGVLAATAVWQAVARVEPPPVFELHLWAVVLAFVLVRHGLRRVLTRLATHRGISHSFPTCAVWAALTYLYYPTTSHVLRLMMALAVVLGFLSHLLLDEVCSVDLRGARVNRAFGTALKFWAPSPWSTLAMYGVLSYLAWQIIRIWPDDPLGSGLPRPPEVPTSLPGVPARWGWVPGDLLRRVGTVHLPNP